jgi:hypothetical protein
MKRIITPLIITFLGFSSFIFAQDTLPYKFITLQQEYTHLEDPVIVTDQEWDDFDETYLYFPIGFDFQLFDTTIDTLTVGVEFSELLQYPIAPGTYSLISPCFGDLMSRFDQNGNVTSTLSYTVEGEGGQRIFKGEWRDIGFYNDELGTNFINFQFWLYEEDGAIEFHYGPSNITYPLDYLFDELQGPIVGLFDTYDLNADDFEIALLLTGDPADPTLEAFTEPIEDSAPAINGLPSDGMVYRFYRNVISGVNTPAKVLSMKVYPTVANDIITIEADDFNTGLEYQIIDLTGKIVVSKMALIDNHLNVSALKTGKYFISLFENGKMIKSGKFIKA